MSPPPPLISYFAKTFVRTFPLHLLSPRQTFRILHVATPTPRQACTAPLLVHLRQAIRYDPSPLEWPLYIHEWPPPVLPFAGLYYISRWCYPDLYKSLTAAKN